MATDVAGRAARRARRRRVVRAGTRPGRAPRSWLAVVGALTATLVVACSSGPGGHPDPVDLDAATDSGQLPWTEVLLPPQTPTTVPFGPPGTDLPAEPRAAGIRVIGDRAGLYGGSPDRVLCDRQRLVDDLEGDPARMQAWSSVFHVDDVRNYVRTLTPVLLRADTRVTNHGFDDGHAAAFQSVLEAGTIVLIDDHGVPRVRCVRGSPLLSPVVNQEAEIQGDPWPGFQQDRLYVVQPSNVAMTEVTVVDLMTGGLVPVPIGSGPQQPAERPNPVVPVEAQAPVVDSPPPPVVVQQAAPRPAPVPSPEPVAPAPPPPPPPPPAPEPQVNYPPAPAPAPAPVPVPPQQIQVQIPGLPPIVIPIPN
ncbi:MULTISPECIES: DUF6777 domain-containing protein [unclassified Rhodococcus (in: high G+C Gram-positive bacteria)]|uniref:DUF6777 domain-containing protein n=1 Tax=unclassified Rhodococcus (in: high G+C Gram-positive bacteria) TaxID=192944 RepID=UPI0016398EF4|nr:MULTISPECIES: DUF6777 domain-containing protein [unclassified Rhodococcus (in: high G+C Gram-positive bacteria)]MBC2641008.1 hypothetical protein [Rhodococcus sp. 3A]MBC2894247.1 hypothetical protein [Rhodococcus sp. 4CII]